MNYEEDLDLNIQEQEGWSPIPQEFHQHKYNSHTADRRRTASGNNGGRQHFGSAPAGGTRRQSEDDVEQECNQEGVDGLPFSSCSTASRSSGAAPSTRRITRRRRSRSIGSSKYHDTSNNSTTSTKRAKERHEHDHDQYQYQTSMDFLFTPYAFDEHLFYADFPRCCDKHAREHLGHNTAYDAPLSSEYLGDEPDHTQHAELEEAVAANDNTSTSTSNCTQQHQQTATKRSKGDHEKSESTGGRVREARHQQEAGHHAGTTDNNKNPHSFDRSAAVITMRRNTRESLSMMTQIHEIMTTMDDAEAYRVYLRLQRKLHRNVLKAGARSEQSRLEVIKLKERLSKEGN